MSEEVKLEDLGFKELQAEAKARKIDISKMKNKVALIKAITKFEDKTDPDEDPTEQAEANPTEEPTPEGEGGGELTTPEEIKEEEIQKGLPKKIKEIKGPIDVFDSKGNHICTYSEEVQGKDYKAILAEFTGPQPKNAPDINKGRTIKPHDTTYNVADVVDATGNIRKTFTREKYGVLYRQMAMSYASAGLGTLIIVNKDGVDVEEELPNKIIAARVELRK